MNKLKTIFLEWFPIAIFIAFIFYSIIVLNMIYKNAEKVRKAEEDAIYYDKIYVKELIQL